jgi:putative transposase
VKFALIDAEKANHPIALACRSLEVSRAGYYAWRDRPESNRDVEDRRLTVRLRAAHEKSRRTYGSPRLHAKLNREGTKVSRKRVIRLMQADGIVARQRKRYRCTTMSDHDQPVAANLLDRQFTADKPNQRWVGDTTEIKTPTGKLYVAVILDLFSRIIVGWALSASNNRHLTLHALEMAVKRRCPDVGLLHHSDQGSTYASEDYRDELEARGITCSMSRRGNCHDNAVAESWFSTMKSELGESFESNGDAKTKLFDYIEVFYNGERLHSVLGYVSPVEFERAARMTQAA